MRTSSQVSALFAVAFCACLSIALNPSRAVCDDITPPWEVLMEPAEPDTEAIKKATTPQSSDKNAVASKTAANENGKKAKPPKKPKEPKAKKPPKEKKPSIAKEPKPTKTAGDKPAATKTDGNIAEPAQRKESDRSAKKEPAKPTEQATPDKSKISAENEITAEPAAPSTEPIKEQATTATSPIESSADSTAAQDDGNIADNSSEQAADSAKSAAHVEKPKRVMLERSYAPPKQNKESVAATTSEPTPSIDATNRRSFGMRAAVGVGGLGSHETIKYIPDGSAAAAIDSIALGSGISASVGFVFLAELSKRMGMNIEFQYTFYSAYGAYTPEKPTADPFWRTYEAYVELHSIEIPILFHIFAGTLEGRWLTYFEVGPQVGINIYGRLYNDKATMRANLEGFAIGPSVGVGVTANKIVWVGLRAHFGLTEYINKMGGYPWTVQLTTTTKF